MKYGHLFLSLFFFTSFVIAENQKLPIIHCEAPEISRDLGQLVEPYLQHAKTGDNIPQIHKNQYPKQISQKQFTHLYKYNNHALSVNNTRFIEAVLLMGYHVKIYYWSLNNNAPTHGTQATLLGFDHQNREFIEIDDQGREHRISYDNAKNIQFAQLIDDNSKEKWWHFLVADKEQRSQKGYINVLTLKEPVEFKTSGSSSKDLAGAAVEVLKTLKECGVENLQQKHLTLVNLQPLQKRGNEIPLVEKNQLCKLAAVSTVFRQGPMGSVFITRPIPQMRLFQMSDRLVFLNLFFWLNKTDPGLLAYVITVSYNPGSRILQIFPNTVMQRLPKHSWFPIGHKITCNFIGFNRIMVRK